MQRFDRSLPRSNIDNSVWQLAADFAYRAARSGLIVPLADIIIFSCGRTHHVPIMHVDKHYGMLDQMFPA